MLSSVLVQDIVWVCLLQELARGLGELLSYEGNVEEDFYLTFQVRRSFITQNRTPPLVCLSDSLSLTSPHLYTVAKVLYIAGWPIFAFYILR